jgi:hypothetical protein
MLYEQQIEAGIDPSLRRTVGRYTRAIGALYRSEAAPYTECWDRGDDDTLYGVDRHSE